MSDLRHDAGIAQSWVETDAAHSIFEEGSIA
jgi:hypothetical protein